MLTERCLPPGRPILVGRFEGGSADNDSVAVGELMVGHNRRTLVELEVGGLGHVRGEAFPVAV